MTENLIENTKTVRKINISRKVWNIWRKNYGKSSGIRKSIFKKDLKEIVIHYSTSYKKNNRKWSYVGRKISNI